MVLRIKDCLLSLKGIHILIQFLLKPRLHRKQKWKEWKSWNTGKTVKCDLVARHNRSPEFSEGAGTCMGLHNNSPVSSQAWKKRGPGALLLTNELFATERFREKGSYCVHL